MPAQRVTYSEDIKVRQLAASGDDFGPVNLAFPEASYIWPDGTDGSEADAYWADLAVVETGSNSTDYDLDALTSGPGGGTVSLAEVRALLINVTAGDLTITPHATNGWTAMLAAAGDLLNLPVGKYRFFVPTDGAWPVSGSDKVITIAATGSGVTYDICFIGTTA